MPRSAVSSVDTLSDNGRIIQYSKDNLTLYNRAFSLRMLGGIHPHDEMLGAGGNVLSSETFWNVEANASGVWEPLEPALTRLDVLGTNASGTFVSRTTTVASKDSLYGGVFRIIYRLTPTERLKWDLEFSPKSSAEYRFFYLWKNVTSYDLSNSLKQLRVSYPGINYTLSWSDVPSSMSTSTSAPSVSPAGFSNGTFYLAVDLGQVLQGSKTTVDPAIDGSVSSPVATAYDFQRKTFFEPTSGRYWAFYYNGSVVYRSSTDGVTWSAAQYVPGNWPGYWDPNYPYTYSPSVINVGRSVVVAYGSLNYTNVAFGGVRTVSAYWANGSISGSTILWSPVHPITFSTQQTCGPGPFNCMLVGIRHVNLALSPTGSLVLTLNWFYEDSYNSQAGQYMCTRSILYGFYNGPALVLHDSTYYCPVGAVFGVLGGELRSVVTQADTQGLMRVLYWGGTYDSSQRIFRSSFLSRSLDAQGNLGSPETLVSYAPDFSALTDNNYGVHVVYTTTSAGVDYVYRSALSESWTPPVSVFAGSAYSPTITLDQSTDKVNVLAVGNSTTSYWTLKMKSKSSIQSWADTTTIYPITEPSFGSFAGYLSANFASASSSNANTICLIWTTGGDSGPYSVMFASIPIQTVWSPYAFPPDPWDGNGLSPYAQYFANLGEYVSPSTGMLTIKQTDLNVPGRGLNLAITRVYVEPYGFLNGAPYNYEKYPWAPMGNGWQLDFPWMNNTQNPNYLHLGDGQGYRIPLVFWDGITATYENHQGENFRLVRYANGTVYLYNKSGVAYNFDPTHRLTSITDSTGSNTLTFSYSNNMISCVVDTVGRSFNFTYSNGLLQTIRQVSGTCNNPGAIVKTIVYGNNGQSLTSAMDPAGRMTYYSYNGTASSTIAAWLVSRVRYPTSWLSNYTYTSALPGTEAYSYRIARQLVSTASGTPVRQFNYIYSQTSGGDQITGSTITAYNATFIGGLWQLQTASYTDYAFSFAGVTWNVSDANHNLVRGVQQRFGIHGEIPREVVIVTDTSGTGWPPGSYTTYYRYDLWGNPIYSRKVINPSTNSYHESFSTYYNGGLSPGFNAFQETFSQNQGTAPDNSWANQNGYWMVQNGSYNGTDTSSQPESIFAWSDVGKADISIQARVYVTYRINSPDQRIGLLAHYPGTGTNKWALVFHTTTAGAKLSLLEEAVGWRAENSCTIWFNSWYTFNFTMRGNQAWGWTNGLGGSCSVSAAFTGALVSETGFGLYAGGSSALFDNVTVATVSPSITGSGFSNSFNLAGAPGANIHNGLAGTAELQNGTGTLPIETYYSYYPWGGLSQEKHRYDSSGIVEWLTMSSTYDSYGNLLSLVDARGNTTSYGHSSKYAYAYLTSLNRTVAGTLISTRYGYDYASGMKLWVYDPNGFNTTYQYDIVGRVTRITYPTLNFTTYRYNDQANYANITSENGWRTRQIYDGLGRLSITQRFLAGVPYSNETTTYNWMDKITSRIDSMGNVYSYQYDVLGRQVKTVGPDGNFTRVLYNDVASWLESIDESGFIKFLAYDRLGRLIEADEQTSPSALRATSYTYDESGNLGAIVTYDNPLRNPETRVQYVYDNLNRMVSARYQDGTSESYSYDSNSNLVRKIDRKSVQTSYSHDSLNRIAAITYYGSTLTSDSYTYDRNSNLLQLQSQNATIRYTYDPRSRVLNENYTINTGGSVRTYAVRYTYNGRLLATITYPDNLVVKYNYDSLGRILAVSKSGGTTYATFSYYRNDKVRGIGFGNGLVANYTYDRLARPLNITLKNGAVTLYSLTHGYNRTGTVASVIGQVNQISDNEQYRYDPLARLTNATITSGGTTNRLWYEYDGPGNRLRQNLNGVLTSSTYTPSNNQLVGSSTPGMTTAYSYDANGNQAIRNVTTTGTAHWTYSWDVANRLVKVRNDAGVQGAYAYDGEGRRVESIEASTTFYAYLGTETLYETVTGGAGTDYIHAGGFRIGKVSGTTINYYHTDSLGSTRLVTNTSKSVVFSDNYQPFGQDNGAHTGSETYKFTGKPYSSSIGLYYDFHRWYDPSIGRFISPDPKHGRLSNPQSLNLYIYVLDRPTSLVDPTGLISEFHDRPCPASGCTSGPDPLFTAVSNWWNSLPPGEQQAIVFTAVVVIAAIVVVGTAGIASPLALAAVGAATSSTFYTATAGSHATLAGAVGSAVAGAVTGYFGGVGGAAAGRFGLLAGMLTAGSGAAGGDILGGLAESALGGRQFSLSDPRTQRRLVLDAGVSALTFGLGRGFRISDLAERLSERQVFGAGDSTFDWYVATPGDALNYQVLSTSLKAGWEVGTDLLGDFASSIGI